MGSTTDTNGRRGLTQSQHAPGALAETCLRSLRRLEFRRATLVRAQEKIPAILVPLAAGKIKGIHQDTWAEPTTGLLFTATGRCLTSHQIHWHDAPKRRPRK